MNLKMHNELLVDIWNKVKSIRTEGQKEYAHDKDNVFANFQRIAMLQELDKKQILMTYLLKHIDGIMSFIKGHKSQREDVRGRIVDVIVYLNLLWGMVDEEEDLYRNGYLKPVRKKDERQTDFKIGDRIH